ncbi:MAG TPA: PRC-barrel domain-containing protein, partial [Solirubrobacteraceae bacterium]|nr:PRC-barrel domain-containing protein [Solirubrobacteraceae bacterium]
MQTAHDLQNWPGETLYDGDGSKIGEITEIYVDRATGEPAWLAVKTGLFGSNVSFVPLREAARAEDGIRVP